MRYIVRKMPNYVLDESFSQIKNLEECYVGNAMETFLGSLIMSNGEAHVNLEDDIILCNDFCKKIESVINKYPDALISFFTLKQSVKKTSVMSGRTFCMNQCVYYPKGWSTDFLKWFDGWKRKREHPTGYDYAMADFMAERKEKYLLFQPSLVQHKQEKSRINSRRSTKRQSKTFIKE